jgi:lipid-A-disaccharide synthase
MWMVRVFFSVGDASGDMYAASVARAIKQLRNSWVLEGIGGSEMLKAGVKLLRYTTPFSAFGFWSALQTSVRFWALTAWRVRSVLMRNPPDLFVPVDLGAFNRRLLLPLAEKGVKVFLLRATEFLGR